jgi:uncharacterized Tic20 family protein
MSLKTCPNCSNPLGAPLLSSGRQVCVKCGWSDHPKKTHARSADDGNSANADGTVLALSLLSHGSVFLTPVVAFPIIIPLVLWLAAKDSTIRANAKEAFNFQVYVFVSGILLIIAGIFAGYFLFALLLPIAILWLLFSLILPIIVMIQLLQKTTDRPTYPFIERFF